jgi:hypothetical protein
MIDYISTRSPSLLVLPLLRSVVALRTKILMGQLCSVIGEDAGVPRLSSESISGLPPRENMALHLFQRAPLDGIPNLASMVSLGSCDSVAGSPPQKNIALHLF